MRPSACSRKKASLTAADSMSSMVKTLRSQSTARAQRGGAGGAAGRERGGGSGEREWGRADEHGGARRARRACGCEPRSTGSSSSSSVDRSTRRHPPEEPRRRSWSRMWSEYLSTHFHTCSRKSSRPGGGGDGERRRARVHVSARFDGAGEPSRAPGSLRSSRRKQQPAAAAAARTQVVPRLALLARNLLLHHSLRRRERRGGARGTERPSAHSSQAARRGSACQRAPAWRCPRGRCQAPTACCSRSCAATARLCLGWRW